ncbi:arylacetamide deacetylase-like [Diadema antillarum]|uniref:arylacetamide deacetylase-like n=1 Tax=Diadema antillarum TaxID=105358 RepID=UPI003A8895D4
MKGNTMLCAIVVALLGFLCAYTLNEPVPPGITEPVKYRLFMTSIRLTRLLISATYLLHRDEPFPNFYVKRIRSIQEYTAPSPRAEIAGSNIRSRVLDLDGVSARIYEPIRRSEEKQPGFVYLHGGGMVLGSADSYDTQTRKIAEGLNAVVVSVNYRLAPEHPFPAGYEDCERATRFFMEHAEEHGVDQRRIGIGGDSAGGHLSASVAQAINDDPGLPNLKLQVLIYPSMQKIDLNTPSYQKYASDFGDGGILSIPSIITFVTLAEFGEVDPYVFEQLLRNNHTSSDFKTKSLEYMYVDHTILPTDFRDPRFYKTRTDPSDGNDALWKHMSHNLLDPRSAPLLRRDLSGLPPAYIVTCGFDALRDDGVFYKHRLEEAGVAVKWVHYEDAFHGVMSLSGLPFQLGHAIIDHIIEFVKETI